MLLELKRLYDRQRVQIKNSRMGKHKKTDVCPIDDIHSDGCCSFRPPSLANPLHVLGREARSPSFEIHNLKITEADMLS